MNVLIVICTGYTGRLSYELVTFFPLRRKATLTTQVDTHQGKKKKAYLKVTTEVWKFTIYYSPTGDASVTVYIKKTNAEGAFFHCLNH